MHAKEMTYSTPTTAVRWVRFGLASLVLGFVMFVLAPMPIEHFSPMTRYVQKAEENNIHPGALYYTDVSVVPASEANSRDTVRYYYDLPKETALH